MSKRLLIALVVIVCCLSGTGFSAAWGWRQLNQPLSLPPDGLMLEIERGAALTTVTRRLESNGVLAHSRLLDWYARLRGTATGIQAGEYRLTAGLTGIGLLEKLGRGEVFLHQFTIIEGWRFTEMLARLRQHPAIAISDATGAEIMAGLGEPDLHPEGQFLPDTYSFPRGTPDRELLGWANRALQSTLADAWNDRQDDIAISDPYQGLILASIIEKETALDSERGLISGVFHERLRRRMRLQTDPTVIYGVGDAFTGDLTRVQLDTDTPYNTYTRRGLPPTPIALAGQASIRAAFAPVNSGALYFVASGEPDGSHVFSGSLEEHNAAVRRYLDRQRAGD